VRIKLDESMPSDAQAVATALGHDADTAAAEGLGGQPDQRVLAVSTDDDRILVALDRGFGDVRLHPPGTHAGIVVLRPSAQDAATVLQALTEFLEQPGLGDITGCNVVVRGQLVRVRRPEPPSD